MSDDHQPPSTPDRCWYQFSLRAFFAFVTAVGVFVGAVSLTDRSPTWIVAVSGFTAMLVGGWIAISTRTSRESPPHLIGTLLALYGIVAMLCALLPIVR